MKTLLLPLLLLLSAATSNAQDWCHQGSVWRYYGESMGGVEIDQYTYAKDTIVNNQTCHLLTETIYGDNYYFNFALDTAYGYDTYTYSSGDTTYFYYPNLNSWEAVYFFGAHTGDSITIPNGQIANADTFLQIIIDSVGTVMIDTNQLRFYTYHINTGCSMINNTSGRVIERLGVIDNYLIPYWHCVTDDTYFNLCSYQDNSFALYPSGGCPNLRTGINDINPLALHIYPNPADQEIIITLDKKPVSGSSISISDVMGRVIINSDFSTANTGISTAQMTAGIYIITIFQQGKKIDSQKLMVIH